MLYKKNVFAAHKVFKVSESELKAVKVAVQGRNFAGLLSEFAN
jgi:hypothetical protein